MSSSADPTPMMAILNLQNAGKPIPAVAGTNSFKSIQKIVTLHKMLEWVSMLKYSIQIKLMVS
jgi:hypothetical protein